MSHYKFEILVSFSDFEPRDTFFGTFHISSFVYMAIERPFFGSLLDFLWRKSTRCTIMSVGKKYLPMKRDNYEWSRNKRSFSDEIFAITNLFQHPDMKQYISFNLLEFSSETSIGESRFE